MEPKCDHFIMEKKKNHFWTKSVPKVVLTSLKNRLGESGQYDSVQSIDLVIGGDHGQGKFRSVMKIILRNASGKNIDSFCVKIGHIDCDKDTYHVLKNSVTKPLNDDIKAITDSGSVQFITNLTTKEKSIVFDTIDEIDEEKFSIQKSVPIRILMCGDLAFFAAVLGKVNMSGKWCTWCKLSPSEWRPSGHICGEKWTIDGMSQLREKIMRKEIEAKASNKMGVVEVPLIDTIPIDHTIFSLLHAEIGVGNKILDSFLEWVDYRVENLSEEEITARDDHLKAIDDHKDKVETHTEWLNVNSADLADLRSERREINVWMKGKGLTADERECGLMESKKANIKNKYVGERME